MSDHDVAIDDLRVVAGGRTILSIAALRLGRGEVLTVLGPNGAGKSTLLRVCAGLRRPSSGSVEVLGQPVHRMGSIARTRLRRTIAFLPQELPPAGQLPLTLREVVAIGRTGIAGLMKRLGRNDWRMVDETIEQLGLARVCDATYETLSGGEQRKAMLARALVQRPRLLLLDEPAANLDLGWRENLVDTLDALHAATHATIVLVCHEPEVIPRCCGRLLLLDGGAPIADGDPADVLTEARVASLYGVSLGVVHDRGRHAVIPRGRSA